jgi:hypothetical protein
MVHACNSSYLGKGDKRIIVQGQPEKKQVTLSKKHNKSKRNRSTAQVVENLLSKYEALSSISSTAKKKKIHIYKV